MLHIKVAKATLRLIHTLSRLLFEIPLPSICTLTDGNMTETSREGERERQERKGDVGGNSAETYSCRRREGTEELIKAT